MMKTVQAFLKLSKLANKGQFEWYTIRDLPKFKSVNELKQYLVDYYSEELIQHFFFIVKNENGKLLIMETRLVFKHYPQIR